MEQNIKWKKICIIATGNIIRNAYEAIIEIEKKIFFQVW